MKRLLNQHEGGEIPLKKRKSEIVIPATIIPDSTDDSVTKSRSPEPVAVISVTSVSQKKESDSGELRVQLERERRLRRLLEERLHTVEAQLYPEPAPAAPAAPTAPAALYEQTDVTDCKLETEEVEAPVSAEPAPVPCVVAATAVAAPLLEAAIKAEPRVEVEVLPEAAHESSARLYLASTSRQNLETIVEAIRHLEGDHLFREGAADAPLALTKKPERTPLVAPAPVPVPVQRPGVIVVKHS